MSTESVTPSRMSRISAIACVERENRTHNRPARVTCVTARRCASCERLREGVRPVLTKVHGVVMLCSACEDFCASRGWIQR